MSNRLPEGQPQLQFRLRPVESQVVFGLAAAIVGYFVVTGLDLNLGPLLLLMGLFVGGIWAERAWLVWLMLGVTIYLKYCLVPPGSRFGLRGLQFPDLFSALTVMLLIAICFRYLELARYINTFFPNSKLGQKPDGARKFEFPSLLGGRWWAIPLSIFLAMLLLGAFPFERTPFFAQFRIQPVASRLIFMTLFLFFTWFVGNSILGTFVRRKMKPRQADIQCRSFVAKELWKDTFSFERRRSRQIAKDIQK